MKYVSKAHLNRFVQRVSLDKRPASSSRRAGYPGVKRRTGPTRATPIQEAMRNYHEVWKSGSYSRYSDGTKPVMYTAPLRTTCYVEVGYHFYNWFVKNHPTKRDWESDFILYKTIVKGHVLDFTKCLSDHPKMTRTSTSGYTMCQEVADNARSKGVSMLRVPSARAIGRDCIPVLLQKASTTPIDASKLKLSVANKDASKINATVGKSKRSYRCAR